MNVAIKGTISWPWIQLLARSLCRKAVLSYPTSYYLRKLPPCLSAEGSVWSSIYHRYHPGETVKHKNRIIQYRPTFLDASHFTDVSTLNCSSLRTYQSSNEFQLVQQKGRLCLFLPLSCYGGCRYPNLRIIYSINVQRNIRLCPFNKAKTSTRHGKSETCDN